MTHFTDTELRQWSRSGPGPDRERVIAHVGGCARCAAAYADAIRAQSLTSEQAAAADGDEIAAFVKVGYGVPAKGAVVPFPWRRRILFGAAAAAALILALAVPYVIHERGRGEDVTVRGGGIEALAPIGTVDAGAMFEWTGAPGASSYRVDVGNATGIVFSATTTGTTTRLPVDTWRTLTPDVDYWWTVTARDAADREIASSARQAFRTRSR